MRTSTPSIPPHVPRDQNRHNSRNTQAPHADSSCVKTRENESFPTRSATKHSHTQRISPHNDIRGSGLSQWDPISLHAPGNHFNSDTEKTDCDTPLPQGVPNPTFVAGKIALHVVEILHGHRPVTHLRQWLSPGVYQTLCRRSALVWRIQGKSPRSHAPSIVREYSCPIRPRIEEVTVLVFSHGRVRAISMRMEFENRRWKATALEVV